MATSTTTGIIDVGGAPAGAKKQLRDALAARNVTLTALHAAPQGVMRYRMTGGSQRKIRVEIDQWKKSLEGTDVAYDLHYWFDT